MRGCFLQPLFFDRDLGGFEGFEGFEENATLACCLVQVLFVQSFLFFRFYSPLTIAASSC
jgi:hypothetical protein